MPGPATDSRGGKARSPASGPAAPLLAGVFLLFLLEPGVLPRAAASDWLNPDAEARIDKLLASMTLEQKIAQMIQPEIRWVTPEDVRRYGFGSILNGGGSFPYGR